MGPFVGTGDSTLVSPEKRNTPNEGYVYFGLRGTFDPDELTLRLGITPTSSCAQGARNPQRGLPKTSQWEVSTERIVAEYIDVYELADQVVSKLETHAAHIKDAIAALDLYAVLEVVLYFSTDDEVSTPAIGFSNRVLAFLADVNASIDIDTYILPNENGTELEATASPKSSDEQTDEPERE
jgi:hypothetical protein